MKDKILVLRKNGKTINEIVKELGCAKSTVSYHINNNGLGYISKITKEIITEMKIYYLNHTIIETSKFFKISVSSVKKYCDNKRVLSTKPTKQGRAVEAVQKRRKKIKELAVEYKGGCCEKCGYDKCIAALEFHHIDPNEKDFGIASKGYTRSWVKLKEELDKCIMVCANCHREIHYEIDNKKAE